MSCFHWVPCKSKSTLVNPLASTRREPDIPFFCLPNEFDIRPTHTSPFWLARVLCSIKDEYLSRDRFRSDQVWILGHVTRPVHLSRMIDLLYDLDAWLGWDSVAAEFATLVVIVAAIELVCQGAVALRDMNGGDLEVVLRLARGVRTEKQSVDGVGLVLRAGERFVRERERRTRNTYDSLSGNHWQVRLGQSNACVTTRSYRYGAFFFLKRKRMTVGSLHGKTGRSC